MVVKSWPCWLGRRSRGTEIVEPCRRAVVIDTCASSSAVEPLPWKLSRRDVAVQSWPWWRHRGRRAAAVEPRPSSRGRQVVAVKHGRQAMAAKQVGKAADVKCQWSLRLGRVGIAVELWPPSVEARINGRKAVVVESWRRGAVTLRALSRGHRAVVVKLQPPSRVRQPWPPNCDRRAVIMEP